MIACGQTHESMRSSIGERVRASWADEGGALASEVSREGMVKRKADYGSEVGLELEEYGLRGKSIEVPARREREVVIAEPTGDSVPEGVSTNQLAPVAADVADNEDRGLNSFWSLLAHAGYEVWGAEPALAGTIKGEVDKSTGRGS